MLKAVPERSRCSVGFYRMVELRLLWEHDSIKKKLINLEILKATGKWATQTCNLFRNIIAKRVESAKRVEK